MERNTKIGCTVSGLAALATLAGTTGTVAADDGRGHALELVGVQTDGGVVENPSGFVGTRFVAAEDLYEGDTHVGRAARSCEVVALIEGGVAQFQCTITLTLPGGTLAMQSMPTLTEQGLDDAPAAVTGGTGEHGHARGEATLEELSEIETGYRIELR